MTAEVKFWKQYGPTRNRAHFNYSWFEIGTQYMEKPKLLESNWESYFISGMVSKKHIWDTDLIAHRNILRMEDITQIAFRLHLW